MKWATLIPLVGGLSLGLEEAFETPPSEIISYKDFHKNDQFYLEYMKSRGHKKDILYINSDTNKLEDEHLMPKNLSVVCALPPCAGLSMLNPSLHRSETSRGSDAVQNEWMYKSTEFALSQLKPTVLIGENAPGLFTDLGQGVLKKLTKIAMDNKYRLLLIKTNNIGYGVPQKRPRTFYIFFSDSKIPKFPLNNVYSKITFKQFIESIQIFENDPHHDVEEERKKYQQNLYLQYIQDYWGKDYRQIFIDKYGGGSLSKMIIYDGDRELNINRLIAWLEKKGYTKTKEYNWVKRINGKLKQGKGFWDSLPLVYHTYTNAIITRNYRIIHPTEERFLTQREYMYLMGLPSDFFLDTSKTSVSKRVNLQIMSQNVISNTAKEMGRFIKAYLDGEIKEFITNAYVVKHNINANKIEIVEPEMTCTKLF